MKNNSNSSGGNISHPPQFVPTFVLKKKLRFNATAASTRTLTAASLGDLWCAAATTTSAYQLASHVRLRKIEIWGPMASDLVPVSVQIDWTGSTVGGFGKSNRVSDTSMGATQPAHISSSPPPNSQIAQWMAANATNEICRIIVPVGAVIDVTYDLALRDDASAAAVTGAVAGATVGALYVRPLDSVTNTTLPPVGYSSV